MASPADVLDIVSHSSLICMELADQSGVALNQAEAR